MLKTSQKKGQLSFQEKLLVVNSISDGHLTREKATKMFRVSRVTIWKWMKNFANQGESGLARKKNFSPKKEEISPELEAKILQIKKEFPDYGVLRICQHLRRHELMKVSAEKVRITLAKNGLLNQTNHVLKPAQLRRFEYPSPNLLWQMDIMTLVLKKGIRLYLICILDDYSRFIVSWDIFTRADTDACLSVLQASISRQGKPGAILTDQGRQFFTYGNKSRFSVICEDLGIEHITASAHHPQTLGKIESFFRNIQIELINREHFSDIAQAQSKIKDYIEYYNFDRVHQGIGGLVPADRYFGLEKEVTKLITEPPAKKVYLLGRIEDKKISIQNQGGELKILVDKKPVLVT